MRGIPAAAGDAARGARKRALKGSSRNRSACQSQNKQIGQKHHYSHTIQSQAKPIGGAKIHKLEDTEGCLKLISFHINI